jgi:anti-sigma-K factor RskA
MVHDDYKEMIAAHALSALDAAEERVLNEHLVTCEECRRELAEFEATAAGLALSVDPVEPSRRLREQILKRVGTEHRSDSEKSPSKVLPLQRPQRNLWRALGSIAAVVLFAALIITIIVLWQQNRRLQHENQVAQFVFSPGKTDIKELKGTTEAPGASAKMLIDWQGHALLIVNGLPRPPQGKEYQLWFIEPNHPPKPRKTFSTDNAGKGLVEERVGEVVREYGVFAVTLEPAGGVQAPTGAIYLRSDL